MRRTTRFAQLTAVAAAAGLVMGAGVATADRLLTGADVANGSLTGADVRDGSIGVKDLTRAARPGAAASGRVGNDGAAGPQGAVGATGATGATGPQGPTGPQGAAGPSLTAPGFYGDGSDGDVTVSAGTTTLTRDRAYDDLTLAANAIIAANGYRVFVAGTLTMADGSRISADADGTTSAPQGTLGGGGVSEASPAVRSLGGGGGCVINRSAPSAADGSVMDIRNAAQAVTGRLSSGQRYSGGGYGGFDGGSPDGGGGGVAVVVAREVVGPGTGAASVTARGGQGLCGGGGGVVVVVSGAPLPDEVTLSAAGGGADGGPAWVGEAGTTVVLAPAS